MEILKLEGTEDTPKIMLDKKNGIFEISGRSLPEESAEFYRPVIEWIGEYCKDPNPSTEFTLKLEYFNTASSKLILDVLSALEDIKNMKIVWYFHEDDEDMEEAGAQDHEGISFPLCKAGQFAGRRRHRVLKCPFMLEEKRDFCDNMRNFLIGRDGVSGRGVL